MATFPSVGDLERDSALARIARRHDSTDLRWSEAGTEARDVLAYLRRHRTRTPHRVADDDIWDELVLHAWLHWDERRRERELLKHALQRGLSLREVGSFLGLHSRQGTRDYLDSLDALLDEHRRLTEHSPTDHSPARPRHDGTPDTSEHRPGQTATPRRATNPYVRFKGRSRAVRGANGQYTRDRRARERQRSTREAWLTDHDGAVRQALTDLIDQARRLGIEPGADLAEVPADVPGDVPACADDVVSDGVLADGVRDYLDWVEQDLHGTVGAGTLSAAGLAVRALRSEAVVTECARHHRMPRALARVDRLRADFAALRSPSTP